MEQIILNAEMRHMTGTPAARKLRDKGLVPAVVYAKREEPVHLTVNYHEFVKLLHKHGENAIIELQINKGNESIKKTVLIKEIQDDTIRKGVYHIDFLQIKLTDKIRIRIPLITRGNEEAPGIKEGGILEYILREVEIECLPANIPKEITIDVSSMKIGDIIHVKDLAIDSGVTIINAPEQIAIVIKFEVEKKIEEEKPAEEAAVEPEVIKKGKIEEEGEAGETKDKEEKQKS